jgi:1-acyl-sn-glycerol-3-phosphate acyltransferase
MDKVPRKKPVMFLANHQNALLDPLVIAAFTPFRSFFLTRSDVFTNRLFNQIFGFLRMLPIYRLRDGRDTLAKNEEIFKQCTRLLQKGEAILLFPEANHNIMRRVRPLSKGFTRILFAAFDEDPGIDIQLIPVGINYAKADAFPDRVSFYFGDPISSRSLYNKDDLMESVAAIKNAVFEALKVQTTHIEDLNDYDELQRYLDEVVIDYLRPKQANEALQNFQKGAELSGNKHQKNRHKGFKFLFELLNWPMLWIWRKFVKPRIIEIEFVSTFRFAFAFLMQPVFYLALWWLCTAFINPLVATAIVLGHFLFNLAYVKFGRF